MSAGAGPSRRTLLRRNRVGSGWPMGSWRTIPFGTNTIHRRDSWCSAREAKKTRGSPTTRQTAPAIHWCAASSSGPEDGPDDGRDPGERQRAEQQRGRNPQRHATFGAVGRPVDEHVSRERPEGRADRQRGRRQRDDIRDTERPPGPRGPCGDGQRQRRHDPKHGQTHCARHQKRNECDGPPRPQQDGHGPSHIVRPTGERVGQRGSEGEREGQPSHASRPRAEVGHKPRFAHRPSWWLFQ